MTVILGIDPGSRITGYGLIQTEGTHLKYMDSGCIRTTTEKNLSNRLKIIYDAVQSLVQSYHPDEVALEQVFMHQNPNSALKLGHARGVAMVAATTADTSIFEYSPRQIKQAVAGYGGADKAQVKDMVMRLLSLSRAPQTDASDALAVAICHSHASHLKQIQAKGRVMS